MSEFRNMNRCRNRQLLATVSAGALFAVIGAVHQANADDGDHPPFWIELGGQYSWVQNRQANLVSPFTPTTHPPFEVITPAEMQAPAPTSWDGSVKIAFEPVGTDWTFSAAALYGKSTRNRFLDQITHNPSRPPPYNGGYFAYQDIKSDTTESHTILDFRAGRDFGLGMGLSSTVSFGVRYVQFGATKDALIRSQPTNVNGSLGYFYHKIYARLHADRKFDGVGPSLSWDASAAVAGNRENGEIAVDWGINAAVLFGRQSVRGSHQSTNALYRHFYPTGTPSYISGALNRRKEVTVPNLGGFAGLSWRMSNAKVALGYRADFFFGAMDGGVDAAKKENVGFYGPFASISIGIGG